LKPFGFNELHNYLNSLATKTKTAFTIMPFGHYITSMKLSVCVFMYEEEVEIDPSSSLTLQV
jgi:hypothetical protein